MVGRNFKAVIYLRVSKDNAQINESESISNQRIFIYDYIKNMENIQIISEKIDDGFSGLNMDRPALKEMFNELREGIVNCVIVKDLSRFSRNYIEACQYIENIFPFLGIRFISINDRYDSENAEEINENLLMPFKSLLNASYSKDISIKTKSNLLAKRKNGEFLSAYAPYGYKKLKENKNKLIIDEYASKVVKEIFLSKISGKSNFEIAKCLNEKNILPPAAYKNFCKEKYKSGFSGTSRPMWLPNIIGNILKNPVHKGTLVQGKFYTQDYKLKKRVLKEKSGWVVSPNKHEAIIPERLFDLVENMLLEDTRISPQMKKLYSFSGKIICRKCHGNIVRKIVVGKNKKYIYYSCINSINKKEVCTLKSVYAYLVEESYFILIKIFTKIFLFNQCLPEINNRNKVVLFCRKIYMHDKNIMEICFNFNDVFITRCNNGG